MPTRIVLNDSRSRKRAAAAGRTNANTTTSTTTTSLRPPSSPAMTLLIPHGEKSLPNNNNNNKTQSRQQQQQHASSLTTTTTTTAVVSDSSTVVVHHHATAAAAASATKHRAILGFRSSLLRELSVRTTASVGAAAVHNNNNNSSNNTSDEQQQQQPAALRLSSDDIRASPRLLGYLFAMVAGAVQLVSVIQFYREEIIRDDNPDVDQQHDTEEYYVTAAGSLVFRWKVWAAIYQSAAAVGLSLITILAHMDTVLFPRQWVLVFRDGSHFEQIWLLILVVLWMAGLHVATSVLSVGEYQANVYFTAWIGFCTMALNYGLWRESAGFPSLAERLTSEGTDARQTTYNWIWTGIFSCIFAASATDIYYNSDVVELRYQGERLELDRHDWALIFSIVWTEVGICLLAVALNEGLPLLRRFRCLFRSTGVAFFGWRQLEGIIILTAIGAKFWAILKYTGYGGTINGLSNAYFGIWGSFFNSVFAFGTWLRENKELELQSNREGAEQGEDGDEDYRRSNGISRQGDTSRSDNMEWND